MDSLAMRKMVAIALLLIAAETIVVAQGAFFACNTMKYSIGTPFSLNVDKVLLYLQKRTPKSEDRESSIHLAKPDVFGHANCSKSVTESECGSCLGAAVGDANSYCGLAVGVRAYLDNCGFRYEAYQF